LAAAANAPFIAELPGIVFVAGERIRVRLNVGITGSAQASLFTFV
jgi:hypothetical protein